MDTYTIIEEKLGFETLEHFKYNTQPQHTHSIEMRGMNRESAIVKWKVITSLITEQLKVSSAFIFRLDLPKVEVIVSSPENGNSFTGGDWFTLDDQTAHSWTESLKKKNRLVLPMQEVDDEMLENYEDMQLLSLPLLDINGDVMGMIGVVNEQFPKEWHAIEEQLSKFRDIVEADMHQMAA